MHKARTNIIRKKNKKVTRKWGTVWKGLDYKVIKIYSRSINTYLYEIDGPLLFTWGIQMYKARTNVNREYVGNASRSRTNLLNNSLWDQLRIYWFWKQMKMFKLLVALGQNYEQNEKENFLDELIKMKFIGEWGNPYLQHHCKIVFKKVIIFQTYLHYQHC